MPRSPWLIAAGLLAISTAVNLAVWAWLGAPHVMPAGPSSLTQKLDCVSYTPFQADGSPFEGLAPIDPKLIAADVLRLAPITKCLRTYSAVGHSLSEVAAEAERQELTVLQGAWISRDAIANQAEITEAAAIAKAHPKTVTALVVGNEVLLRNEQTPAGLVALINQAKDISGLPVTYADVWEFWLKNPSVADAVDFITIHILPFWEDDPVAAADASRHVAGIYGRVSAAFPGRRIVIGEVGWPSAGRMREAALPSPANQARVLHDVVAMARAKGITANIIEAFDQPWKRRLEGAVGGHWGLFDAYARAPKFTWASAVSNHPCWKSQAAGSIIFSALILLFCARVARRRPDPSQSVPAHAWAGAGVIATIAPLLASFSVEPLIAGAFGATGIARACMLGSVALAAPFVAVGVVASARTPSLAQMIGPKDIRAKCPLSRAMGIIFIATILAAIQVALSLTFDPRYWDFPFAILTAAALAFAVLALRPISTARTTSGVAEKMCASVLGSCAVVIVLNEGLSNWQAVWLALALTSLALTLWLTPGLHNPDAPTPKGSARS